MLKIGDRVVYEPNLDEFPNTNADGTVLEVIEHKSYEYRVRWDNDDPDDIYHEAQLYKP